MSGNQRGPAAAFAGAMMALAVLAGCASAPGPGQGAAMDPAGMDHSGMQHGESPATPAAVAPGQPAKTLSPDALDAPAPTSVADAQRSAEMAGSHSGHGAHGVARYSHVDAGRGPGASEGSEKQAAGAESAGEHSHESHESHGAAESAPGEEAAVYVCPMHPEVVSGAPGKCPKCGMALVEKRREE